MQLDRKGTAQQWLLPIIVETVSEVGDTPVHRCQVVANHYDWTKLSHRMELKLLVWAVWTQLQTPVPMYQVTPGEFEKIMMGQAIPSVLWRKPPITEPSLEDYVLSEQESRQAKETDELPQLNAYLEASGVKQWWSEASSLIDKEAQSEAEAASEASRVTPASPEKSPPRNPMTGGKRQTQQANWDAILNSARTVWAREPSLSYADMIQRLKGMSHLKASSFTDSAIHKRLRPAAPDQVRGKPGRKPKQSA
jgi:hypothetical protein